RTKFQFEMVCERPLPPSAALPLVRGDASGASEGVAHTPSRMHGQRPSGPESRHPSEATNCVIVSAYVLTCVQNHCCSGSVSSRGVHEGSSRPNFKVVEAQTRSGFRFSLTRLSLVPELRPGLE